MSSFHDRIPSLSGNKTASFRADDCVGNATLANGAVVSKRV